MLRLIHPPLTGAFPPDCAADPTFDLVVEELARAKESVEILAAGRAARIEDFHTLRMWGSGKARKLRYKPADKGHAHEFEVFAEAIRGQDDPARIAGFAFDTSRAALAAVRSLATGNAVEV